MITRCGLGLALVLGGCAVGTTPSKVASNAQVKVHGVYENVDGTAYAQKEVALYRNTLGCAQWSWLALGADSPFAGDTTDAQGNYLFSLTGDQSKGFGNTALCFTVTTRDPEQWGVLQRQYAAFANFTVQQADVAVPELRPWDGSATSSASASGYTLSWADLAASHGYPAKDYSVMLGSDSGTVWRATAGASLSAVIPGYLLEDFSTVSWGPMAHAPVDGSGTTFDRYFSGKGVSLSNSAPAAPESRGASCKSEIQAQLGSPCPLTDGKLTSATLGVQDPAPPGGQPPPARYPTFVDLDLGAPKPVRRAVVREPVTIAELQQGATSAPDPQIEIDDSADGQTYAKVAGPFSIAQSGYQGYLDLDLGSAQTTRYVRLKLVQSAQAKVSFSSLDEVSLWP